MRRRTNPVLPIASAICGSCSRSWGCSDREGESTTARRRPLASGALAGWYKIQLMACGIGAGYLRLQWRASPPETSAPAPQTIVAVACGAAARQPSAHASASAASLRAATLAPCRARRARCAPPSRPRLPLAALAQKPPNPCFQTQRPSARWRRLRLNRHRRSQVSRARCLCGDVTWQFDGPFGLGKRLNPLGRCLPPHPNQAHGRAARLR